MTRARATQWAGGLIVLLVLPHLAGCGDGSSGSSSVGCSAVGYVKEAASQDGISGATVTIGTRSSTTTSEGYYQITRLPTGVLSRTVTATGYSSYADTIAAQSGVNTFPDVFLVDAPPPPPPP